VLAGRVLAGRILRPRANAGHAARFSDAGRLRLRGRDRALPNDYTSGNVAKSVYNQVKREIDAAERACSAGNEAKATAMIRASEARHGYSTHL
jgi:hypothetical protein